MILLVTISAWLKKNAVAMQVGFACWLAFLSGCAIHPFDNLEEWKEIQTRNFIFATNAEEKKALEIARHFETFRAVALRILTIPSFVEKKPILVYLFKNKRSYDPFKPSEGIEGYFFPIKSKDNLEDEFNVIVLYADPFGVASKYSVVNHEYIHYLFSRDPHFIPLWYEEGLAGLFETFEFADGKVLFGKPDEARLWVVNNVFEWVPMDEFLSDQVAYEEIKGFTHAHTQAWALMHYFFFGSADNYKKLDKFLFLLNDGSHYYEDALMSAFGLTPEELLEELKRHVNKESLQYSEMNLSDTMVDHRHHTRYFRNDEAKLVLQTLLNIVHQEEKHP